MVSECPVAMEIGVHTQHLTYPISIQSRSALRVEAGKSWQHFSYESCRSRVLVDGWLLAGIPWFFSPSTTVSKDSIHVNFGKESLPYACLDPHIALDSASLLWAFRQIRTRPQTYSFAAGASRGLVFRRGELDK